MGNICKLPLEPKVNSHADTKRVQITENWKHSYLAGVALTGPVPKCEAAQQRSSATPPLAALAALGVVPSTPSAPTRAAPRA